MDLRSTAWFVAALGPSVLSFACSSPEQPGVANAATSGGVGGAASVGTAGTTVGGVSTTGQGGSTTTMGGSGTATTGAPPGTTTGAGTTGAGTTGAGTTGASATTTGGSLPSTSCTFSVTQTMSDVIPTVGIVEFSVDLPSIESATIEFGLDTSYGLTAPVDLAEQNYRTVLLGMRTSSEYHYRVVAVSGGQQCASEDFTLTTGAQPNGFELPDVVTPLPEQRFGGYTITARWGMSNGGPAFILDPDNQLVWWYTGEDDVIRARMSYDGKAMWMRNTAQLDGTGVVLRVSMDGLNEERWELPTTTHDLAVIPDGHLGLISHASNGCDEILEFDPDSGQTTTLFNLTDAHGALDCHVNYLAYSALDDTFYISDWAESSVVKISRTGELIWVLNGQAATISGTDWVRQHGIHVLAPDHLLIFSNGDTGASSLALEFQLDLNAMTATELWRYDSGLQANFGGDVQRLSNGNTMVTYSVSGVIHEVNPAGELVEELSWGSGTTVSYLIKRPSLYGGPPPKIHGD